MSLILLRNTSKYIRHTALPQQNNQYRTYIYRIQIHNCLLAPAPRDAMDTRWVVLFLSSEQLAQPETEALYLLPAHGTGNSSRDGREGRGFPLSIMHIC